MVAWAAEIQAGSAVLPNRVTDDPDGARQRAVTADELGPVARNTASFVVYIKKSNLAGKFIAVRIACKQRSTGGIYLRNDVHPGLFGQISQYPFYTARYRKLARPSGFIAYFQYCEFDGSVKGDIDPEFRMNAVLAVFKNTVAESMPGNIKSRPRTW